MAHGDRMPFPQSLGVALALLLSIAFLVVRARAARTTSNVKVFFTDVDGTIVHYYDGAEDAAPSAQVSLALPASKTGRRGFISHETLRLAAKIRAAGTRLVIVSGMRFSTFADRLPYLPYADAYVIDNGGRVFTPTSSAAAAAALKTKASSAPATENSASTTKNSSRTTRNSAGTTKSSAAGAAELHLCTGPSVTDLQEDLGWRDLLADACGPFRDDSLPHKERKGPLWDACRALEANGWEVDTHEYFTMIRVFGRKKGSGAAKKKEKDPSNNARDSSNNNNEKVLKPSKDDVKAAEEEMKAALQELDPCLTFSSNLGLAIVYPKFSGKKNAAAYVAERCFGAGLEDCAAMGDDENDIEMTLAVGKGAFLTGFTSKAVEEAVASNPGRFLVAKAKGVGASDEMLARVLEACEARDGGIGPDENLSG